MDNLVELVTDVRNSMYEEKKVMAVFLDVSSAYDNVQKNILVRQLIEEKCPEKIIGYINKWLGGKNNEIYIRRRQYGKKDGRPRSTTGGEILSPLLYAFYTKELGKGLDKNVQMLQYADDIVLYNTGNGGKEQR